MTSYCFESFRCSILYNDLSTVTPLCSRDREYGAGLESTANRSVTKSPDVAVMTALLSTVMLGRSEIDEKEKD